MCVPPPVSCCRPGAVRPRPQEARRLRGCPATGHPSCRYRHRRTLGGDGADRRSDRHLRMERARRDHLVGDTTKLGTETILYMGFVQAAVYDAVVGVAGRYAPYRFHAHAPRGPRSRRPRWPPPTRSPGIWGCGLPTGRSTTTSSPSPRRVAVYPGERLERYTGGGKPGAISGSLV